MRKLICPACSPVQLIPMKEKQSQDVVGRCPQCNGLWLNAKVVHVCLRELQANQSSVPVHAFASQGRDCPQCQVGLFEYCFPGTQVLVDACKQCDGIWLDAGEWQEIRKAKQQKPPMTCPKCGLEQAQAETCQSCGILIEKAKQLQKVDAYLAMCLDEHFQGALEFFIQQEVHFLEALTPFEQGNRYKVTVHTRNEMGSIYRYGYAKEHSDSILSKLGLQFLGPMRGFTIKYTTREGEQLLVLKKKFSIYFHELSVFGPNNELIGKIQRKFKWVHHFYHILDEKDGYLLEIKGPNILSVNRLRMQWDYQVRSPGNNHVALISKQYSGLLKEMFTDADQFNCQIKKEVSLKEKILIFAAFVLIDLTQFENNNGGSGFDITSFLFDHRF